MPLPIAIILLLVTLDLVEASYPRIDRLLGASKGSKMNSSDKNKRHSPKSSKTKYRNRSKSAETITKMSISSKSESRDDEKKKKMIMMKRKNGMAMGVPGKNNHPTEMPSTATPSNEAPTTSTTNIRGLALVVDFANSKLEDYQDDPQAFNNMHDIRQQLDDMESHWMWMSRGQHQIEWSTDRITLNRDLAPGQYGNSWETFRDVIAEALWLHNPNVASKYDSDGDNILDVVWVVASAKAEKADDDISKWFWLIGGRSIHHNVDMFVDAQGSGAVLSRCTGCFNHEVAHTKAVGLPDLYGDYNTLGSLSIMSYPWDKPPPGLLAWEMMKLEWIIPQRVSDTTTNITLKPLEQGGGAVVVQESHSECFMLEYRQRTLNGFFGSSGPNFDGILITHINKNATNWNFAYPPFIRVETADGNLPFRTWPSESDLWYPENDKMPALGYESSGFRVHNFTRTNGGKAMQVDITFTK